MRLIEVRVMVVVQVEVSDLVAATNESCARCEVRENIQNVLMHAACCGSLNPDEVPGEVVHAMAREAQPLTSSRN